MSQTYEAFNGNFDLIKINFLIKGNKLIMWCMHYRCIKCPVLCLVINKVRFIYQIWASIYTGTWGYILTDVHHS